MALNIIIRTRASELARRRVEVARQNLRGYYELECKHGSRFQSKLTKGTIKKVYEEHTDIDAAARAATEQTRTVTDDATGKLE